MKLKIVLGVLSLSTIIGISGCGSDSKSSDNDIQNDTIDMVVSTYVDRKSGFANLVDSTKVQNITPTRGLDIDPYTGIYTHNGFVYFTGSAASNKISKYSVQADNSFKLEKEITVNESGSSNPTYLTFVNDNKAYLSLTGAGELLVLNLSPFSIEKRIPLADYAMDENTELGGDDTNPEPTCGVIRDGKYYLGLAQINTSDPVAGAFMCRGKASVLIIDATTDEVVKHITDDRTCFSGPIGTNSQFTIDEHGDIYVNNVASHGMLANKSPGYLRIKNGEDQFDPAYFFDLRGLDLSADFPDLNASMAKVAYVFKEQYKGSELYVTANILGLSSNPPNFLTDRTYQPYKINLHNKTATKLDMLPSSGFSANVVTHKGEIIFPASTVNGNGLYKVGDKEPYITTDGAPIHLLDFTK